MFINRCIFAYISLLFGYIELIRSGFLGRRQSIDLLDDLDFDFLNGMKADLDVADAFGDDTDNDEEDEPEEGPEEDKGDE